MSTPQPLIGKRNEGVKTTPVMTGDEFGETPIFGFNVEQEGDYLRNWPVNGLLAGKLVSLRATKTEDPDDSREYACIESVDGVKFRVYTPGQLRHQLAQAGIGSYVEMTYLGKEKVEGFKAMLHQFKVEVATTIN